MAFPDVTTLLDDFNRANGAPGSNWTAVTGRGNGAITSNRMTFAANGSACYYNPLTCVDGNAIGTAAGVSGGTAGGVIWRAAGANGYGWYHAGSFNQVFRLDDNSAVGSSFTQAWSAGDLMGVRFVGTSFELYRKPAAGAWGASPLATRTDSTFTTAGGIGLYGDNSGSNQWDDFSGGSLDVLAAPRRRLLLLGVG